jgi:hypothetical protein
MKKAFLFVALGLMLTTPVWGIAVFTPPWVLNPTDPKWAGSSVTSQAWEFWGNPLGTTSPAHWNNPYGPPAPFTPVNASPQFVSNGPGLTGVNTWHVDQTGGGFSVLLPNDPKNRPFKMIHLQYTSDKSSTGAPQTNPQGTAAAGGVAGHGPSDGGDYWYTYEWTITIRPNPASEWIFVPFPASTNIGEVDIATICYTPEPGTICLLALGVLARVRRRRN